mgnify:CR=1 FL=1
MKTPAEEKGYKVGQVFEATDGFRNASTKTGDIVVLERDDGTGCPWFFNATTQGANNSQGYTCGEVSGVVRIYPPEPAETIELMGKTYNKAEIEEALSKVCAISD